MRVVVVADVGVVVVSTGAEQIQKLRQRLVAQVHVKVGWTCSTLLHCCVDTVQVTTLGHLKPIYSSSFGNSSINAAAVDTAFSRL